MVKDQHKQWHEWFKRERIVQKLRSSSEPNRDFVMYWSICIMVIRLGEIFLSLLEPLNSRM
jgi:hypothetical protein